MEVTRGVLQLPQLSIRPNNGKANGEGSYQGAAAAVATDGPEHSTGSAVETITGLSGSPRVPVRSFCLQQFVPRHGNVRFFTVWRQHQPQSRDSQAAASDRRNAVPNLRASGSRSAREGSLLCPCSSQLGRISQAADTTDIRTSTFVCDVFLQRYPIATPTSSSESSAHSASVDPSIEEEPRPLPKEEANESAIDESGEQHRFDISSTDGSSRQLWMDHVERTEELVPLQIYRGRVPKRRKRQGRGGVRHLQVHHGSYGDSNGSDDSDEEQRELEETERVLERLALDSNVVIAQLFHMKHATAELFNRVNNVAGRSAAPRCVLGLACEFFLDARDKQAHFAGVAGVHWAGCTPSWEALRFQDATAAKLSAFYASVTASDDAGDAGETRADVPRAGPKTLQQALRLFDELNPRFPSAQSPLVDAAQWKFRSALLPPDAAPRFVGAEVPKKFRRGRFRPLLRPEQAVSVSRLHLSPRAPSPLASAVRHPLSRRFAAQEAAPDSVLVSPK